MIAVALVAGPVALAVPVLVWIGRLRLAALGWIAGLAMLGAGIGVAVAPNSQPGSGQGAFSTAVQLLGAIAFAAVLVGLAEWAPATDSPPTQAPALSLEPGQPLEPSPDQTPVPVPSSEPALGAGSGPDAGASPVRAAIPAERHETA